MSKTETPVFVDFKTRKEDFNLFELEDGSRLKTKFVLIALMKHGEGNYSFTTQVVLGIDFAKEIGPPDNKIYSVEELRKAVINDDLKFTQTQEGESVYDVVDGNILSVKLALASVAKTSRFDARGIPQYMVSTSPLIKVKKAK